MLTVPDVPNIKIDGAKVAALANQALGPGNDTLAQGSAGHYERTIAALFARIARAATGRAVLKAIRKRSEHVMTVEPELMKRPGMKPNAFAEALDTRAAGRPGRGSSTLITISPSDWTGHMPELPGAVGGYTGPGTAVDELLLHEVFHGLRHMAGLRMKRGVPGQKEYHNFEEFYAILIANIYRSELGRSGLRADHAGFYTLGDVGIVSQDAWMKHKFNRGHLRKLGNQMPDLWDALAKVKAAFNPIAAF